MTDDNKPKTPHRHLVWRLALTLIVPLALLAATEWGLRLAGMGHPTTFFVKHHDGTGYSPNAQFGWRYRCREMAWPFLMSSPKPANTLRLFVLGESAAYGTPDPTFSVSRQLEVMLRAQYPQARLEVFNTAMMGINSHVIRDIARECARHGADLLVVYMGNNELIGAYGVGAAAEGSTVGLSLPLIRASLWARGTRLGQATDRFLGKRDWLTPKDQDEAFFQKNRIHPDDPRREKVYKNFRANLHEVCRSGPKVLLSTVAVNLRDCPPLGSLHRRGLTAAEQARWEEAYRRGETNAERGNWSEAVRHYQIAAELDGQFADLQYRLGQAFEALGDLPRSRHHLSLACDYNAMPFGANSHINQIIRDIAQQQPPDRVRLVDAAELSLEPDLFWEHVHLTFRGNYRLARTLLPGVVALLEASLGPATGTIPSEDECAAALAYTRWDELKLTQPVVRLTARPPFTAQLDHARRQARAEAALAALAREFQQPTQQQQSLEIYHAALRRSPDDWMLRHNYAELLAALRRFEEAAAQMKLVADRFPRYTPFQWMWRAYLAAATETRVTELVKQGNELCRQGRFAEAAQIYRHALALAPQLHGLHNNLGGVLLRTGATNEAIAHLEEALKLSPDYVPALMNLGTAYAATRNDAAAIRLFRRALEREPGSRDAALKLAWVLATGCDPAQRNGAEAVRLAETLCQAPNGRTPGALDLLAAAYAETGRFDDAIRVATEAQEEAIRRGLLSQAAVIGERLQRYKNRQPYHAP